MKPFNYDAPMVSLELSCLCSEHIRGAYGGRGLAQREADECPVGPSIVSHLGMLSQRPFVSAIRQMRSYGKAIILSLSRM